MFLSKLVLNDRLSKVHRDLGNAHKLHQRIMQGFPDGDLDLPRKDWQILYRQEPDPHGNVILVQSNCEPDWCRLPADYLLPQDEPRVKPLHLADWDLGSDRVFQFRIKVNPVKREAQSRKIVALYKPEDHLSWFERQADSHGFEVCGVSSLPVPDIIGRKQEGKGVIKLFAVVLQGQLRVKEREKFVVAVMQGIGKGKAYGCGLLSIAKGG